MAEPDRDAPGVLKAFSIGAVACPHCKGVHIDMLAEDGSVIASGFLPFVAWMRMTSEATLGAADVMAQLIETDIREHSF